MQNDIEEALQTAWAAARAAEDTRAYHRRRTMRGSSQREKDIEVALDRIRRAMLPLRSYMGAAPYKPSTAAQTAITEQIREASLRLQSERRKLWKMKKRD